MGMSITYCASEWIKEKIELEEPILRKEFKYKDYGLDEEYNPFVFEQDITFFLEEKNGRIKSSEALKTLKGMSEVYVDYTKEILKNLEEENEAREIFEAMKKEYEEGEYLIVGEKSLFLVKETEKKERRIWKPKEIVNYDEYSDVMWMSLGHTDKYGCNINEAFIYNMDLWEYLEGTEEGNKLDEKIKRDTKYLGEAFEKMIETMENFDDDEFYEARKERFKKFLHVLKSGAKIVYM